MIQIAHYISYIKEMLLLNKIEDIFILWFPIFSCRFITWIQTWVYFMSGTEPDIAKSMTWFLLSRGLQSPRKDKHINESLLYCLAKVPWKKQPETGWSSEDLFGTYNPQGARVKKTISGAGKMGNNAKQCTPAPATPLQ